MKFWIVSSALGRDHMYSVVTECFGTVSECCPHSYRAIRHRIALSRRSVSDLSHLSVGPPPSHAAPDFHCLWCTWYWVRALERDSALLHHFLLVYRGHKCKEALSHLSIPYHSVASSFSPRVSVMFLLFNFGGQRVLKVICNRGLAAAPQSRAEASLEKEERLHIPSESHGKYVWNNDIWV